MAPRLSITHIPANHLVICYHLKHSISCAIRILIIGFHRPAKIRNVLENCLYVKVLTPRFELGLTALFSQPSYFYEEPLPPLPVDIISWRRYTIPYHVNILYCFKELFLERKTGLEPATFSLEG